MSMYNTLTRKLQLTSVIAARLKSRRIWPGGQLVRRGGVLMEYSDYLRDEAAKYRTIAENNEDPFAKKEFLELAEVCEEVANDIDDRRASG